MNKNFNKNYKLLTLFSLSYIEKYLQELTNLSFEYASNFIFSYSIEDFKNIPIHFYKYSNYSTEDIISKFLYLLNNYMEKDPFFNGLYLYSNFKFKIKFNQFMQVIGVRGKSGIKNFENYILSNLISGFTLKDFILSSFKTRESIIDSSVNISSSGYLTRKLVEGLRNVQIKEIKCNTKYSCLSQKTKEFLNIPFLCLNNKSICSFCLNVLCKYNIFMSFNKGVISGQALGEPSTQMLLRTFHLGSNPVNVSNITNINYCSVGKNINYFFYKNKVNFRFYNFNDINCSKNFNYYNFSYFIKFKMYNDIHNILNNNYIKFLILYNNFKCLWNLFVFFKNIFKFNFNKVDKNNYKNLSYYKY